MIINKCGCCFPDHFKFPQATPASDFYTELKGIGSKETDAVNLELDQLQTKTRKRK